ncbi:MAG: Ku protein [Hyphomicrobiales bacterium]
MAARASWRGYLRLSLVACPIALYPATSDREKVHFHRINRRTGHRVHVQNVDAETGEVIDKEDLGRGYETSGGKIVPIEDEELEAVALESRRVIDIDQFVPAKEIDQLYNIRPYYLAPEGEVASQPFAVIREAISKEGMVALARVVLTSREHVIALEPRGKGLMGTLLRYPYEVRDEHEVFDDIPDERIPKDMLDLAVHIVKSKAAPFRPEKFEDRYENAVRDLIARKEKGEKLESPAEPRPANVINLMDALRRSIESKGATKPAGRSAPKKRKPAAPKKAAQKAPTKRKARRAA